MGLKETNALLAAISQTQARFLNDVDSKELFSDLLDDFVALSESEFGFIGEVLSGSDGKPYLKTHAIGEIEWNPALGQPPALSKADGLEFHNLDNLFGEVIKGGKAVIVGNPDQDPRRGGVPAGHPTLKTFMGVPVMSGGEMVGMIGVANRDGGYDLALAEFLRPLLDTYGQLIALIRANKQRSAIQSRLTAVVETAADAIIVIDSKGLISSANPAVERIFGYTPEALLGKNINILMSGTHQKQHDSYIDHFLQTGEKNIIGIGRELEAKKANGEIIAIHLSVSKFSIDGEHFFTGVIRDISELKKIQGASMRLKQTLDQVYDAVYLFEPETLRITYANQGAVRHLGLSIKELNQLTLLDIAPFLDEEAFRQLVVPLCSGEKASFTFTAIQKHKDGRHLPVEMLLQYLKSQGEPASFVAIVRDISERIENENALRESDERLRRSQYFANVGTWDWNIKTGGLFWSERIAPLFGYSEGELETTYENFLNAVHPDDQQDVIDAVNACVENGKEYNIHHRCVWPDGTVRWVLERGDVVRDSKGNPLRMLGVVQDITELKNTQDNLQLAKDEAERANRAKSDFLSRMSHELRTPLNAIMGFAQLFEYDQLATQQHKDTAAEIYRAGRHLRTLIDDVLDLAKIEAEHMDVLLEPIALSEVVAECSRLIQPLVEQRSVTLDADFDQCNELYVLADQTRLKQVLLNLLSNAIKYNREHGIVSLSCEKRPNDMLRINIADTGMGISEENRLNLFKPFSRLVDEFNDVEGSGIGLSITKQLVELMKGNIGMDSQPGSGSNFWIELAIAEAFPVDALIEQDTLDQCHSDEVADALLNKIAEARILVVEDNPTNCKVFESQLGVLGFHAPIFTCRVWMAMPWFVISGS